MNQILDGATANGDSLIVEHRGGPLDVIVGGTFDGCTVTPYAQFTDSAGNLTGYIPLSNGSEEATTWTGPMVKIFGPIRPCSFKLVISDADTSTDIDAWM